VLLSSDLGQADNPLHPDGLQAMYQYPVSQGITVADVASKVAKRLPIA